MPQTVKGVVARSKGADLELVDVPEPGAGEALVQLRSCGVRHTDLHYREGGINDEFPFLLGHEAAGFGAAVNTGGVGRGDSITVIGCDGVGNAAIAGARFAGDIEAAFDEMERGEVLCSVVVP
jgi:Zn-dependent alcohol dehydrogenase